MGYVLDTNSLRVLQNYYPGTFGSFWEGLDGLIAQDVVWSVREVKRELENQIRKDWFQDWVKANRGIFKTPSAAETNVVAQIFAVPHFHGLVGKKQLLQGIPVADPWVIAAAKVEQATVVTEEALKPNAARIPNVCQHFGIQCMNLEAFVESLNWKF